MPTKQIEPGASEELQTVADAVLKARKVLVVTGAGISTNSGIPDFRSENGLYSLIQAQFEAASRSHPVAEPSESMEGTINEPEGRDRKRRKISPEEEKPVIAFDEPAILNGTRPCVLEVPASDSLENVERAAVGDGVDDESNQLATTTHTPCTRRTSTAKAEVTTTPPSSPPLEAFRYPSSVLRMRHHFNGVPLSSSPLSSPPPILFDPFLSPSPSEDETNESSPPGDSSAEASDSENDEPKDDVCAASHIITKANLPNMKGKDLFDASIWADPLRTSVFYTFATSLRQKIRDAEPTTSHRFISHLRDRGKLVRCYTQNIDQIEEKVGLSTTLSDGPGSRGRFSRRSTANANQLSKMVKEASLIADGNSEKVEGENGSAAEATPPATQETAKNQADEQNDGDTADAVPSSQTADTNRSAQKLEVPRSGVECVFLHGSLEQLRCFLCGRISDWDTDREHETLSGQQPECPHCAGAAADREERGKRALGVGRLRPDIVLYGEEHPSAHLISPIVTHDLSLSPEMLLILGTSLRVHGLKVIVREFAKAVHSKGGIVVFINFTKPSDSVWGDIIDYWIQWDCDAWVDDLRDRVPRLWQDPSAERSRKLGHDQSGISAASGTPSEHGLAGDEPSKPKRCRVAANPLATRDTKVTGAYWTRRIVRQLHRITGVPKPPRPTPSHRRISTTSVPTLSSSPDESPPNNSQTVPKVKSARSRKSAPGALEKAKRKTSTLNPNHTRPRLSNQSIHGSEEHREKGQLNLDHCPQISSTTSPTLASYPTYVNFPSATITVDSFSSPSNSILDSVKANARVRKRKTIDGEEVQLPKIGRAKTQSPMPHAGANAATTSRARRAEGLKLAPMLSSEIGGCCWSGYGKPQPMEPRSPPAGPLSSISPNLRMAEVPGRRLAFGYEDPLPMHMSKPYAPPQPPPMLMPGNVPFSATRFAPPSQKNLPQRAVMHRWAEGCRPLSGGFMDEKENVTATAPVPVNIDAALALAEIYEQAWGKPC